MLRAVGVALLLGLLWVPAAPALEVPPLAARVNDLAGLLDSGTRARLEERLAEYEQRTGHQLALLTVPSLEGDPIEDLSIRVVEAWQLGDAERDDGLLLLVAVAERSVRIEVGYGLEGEIPDAIVARIIRGEITPAFRRGDFAAGIEAALDALMRLADGGAYAPQRQDSFAAGWVVLLIFVALAVLLLWAASGPAAGPPAAGRARPPAGRRDDDLWIGGHPRGGWGGGGGLGGAGGGFGGGGGGFGGGGASGGW